MRSRFWPRSSRGRALAIGALGLAVAAAGGLALWQRARRQDRRPVVGDAAGAPASWQIVYDRELAGAADLFLVPAGGGVERRLTDDPAYDSLARWTPDGQRIVFTSGRSGSPQLWAIDADGGRLRRLRTNRATEYQADVSPDGRQLAFLSNLDGPERLMIEDLGTGTVRELVRHGDHPILGNPHWSPDGRLIAFSSNWRVGHHIYVVEAASGRQRRISSLTSGGCEPRFSRDGRRLAYVSRGFMAPTSRLVEHDLASGEERVLVDWPALNYDPAYAPDGSELAFASNIAGRFAIYRQRLSDGRAWRVTFGPGDARNPDYRPSSASPSGLRVGDR